MARNTKATKEVAIRTFTCAGTSVFYGQLTLRFCNGTVARRKAVLEYHGHEDVRLQELPKAMTKEDATKYMIGKKVAFAAKALMPSKAIYAEAVAA